MLDASNPAETAKNFALMYMEGSAKLWQTRSDRTDAAEKALTSLQTALQSFRDAMAGLVPVDGSMAKYAAALSNTAYGSVSMAEGAKPGTYSLFVQQLAQASQKAYEALPAGVSAAGAGTVTIGQANGEAFDVDIAAADKDGDGNVSPTELARAINQQSGGNVNASVVTDPGTGRATLVLSSAETGAQGDITVDASGVTDTALRSALSTAKETTVAQDAIVLLGGENGVEMRQASNTFSGIEGVTMTFTKAMQSGQTLSLTVAADTTATNEAVQKFVDSYNELQKKLGELMLSSETASGPFSGDTALHALRDQMTQLLHKDFGGKTLLQLGISSDKDGVLKLDAAALSKALDANPFALDAVFGDKDKALLGGIDKLLNTWLDGSTGQVGKRKASIDLEKKQLESKDAELKARYNAIYDRYLKQWSAINVMQMQMQQTIDTLKDLFTPTKN